MNEIQNVFVCLDGSSRSSSAHEVAKERNITNTEYLVGGKRLILSIDKTRVKEMLKGKKVWLITDREMDEEKQTSEVEAILDELQIENERITFVGILTKIEAALTGKL